MQTYAYGFPRIGAKRDYKRIVESCWKEDFSPAAIKTLEAGFGELEGQMLDAYGKAGIGNFSTGELSHYDAMLDQAVRLRLYHPKSWREYYDLCRGGNALEMTKWFNTNYHYLVPEFGGKKPDLRFDKTVFPASDKPFAMIGPYTFVRLAKGVANFNEAVEAAAEVYAQAMGQYKQVWLHEPAFVMDVSADHVALIEKIYRRLGEAGTDITLFSYYGGVDFLDTLYGLPINAIGLDFIRGGESLDEIIANGFPEDKTLIAGLVDGRSVWRTDLASAAQKAEKLAGKVKQLAVSNGAPLYHLPVSLALEEKLAPELKAQLSFATEKLSEIALLAKIAAGEEKAPALPASNYGENKQVQAKTAALKEKDFLRKPDFAERQEIQHQHFKLPLFPTTTIGSFPQTAEVRKARLKFRKGEMSAGDWESFVQKTIHDTIRHQEDVGLDVLVHGECERTDMVEFFAEKMDGIAFTQHGWVLSYGTRGYRPPIIYGDVKRAETMTVKEIAYAQSLTDKPVKGMLTGPITIIAWSFVRGDIPVHEVAYQIGLALQEEVKDYEKAGIGIIQIDEPAFREMAPNKQRDWAAYFAWAVKAFKLCSASAKAQTQIHSHMCYAEFNDIINEIQQMDFDAISIEASRSGGEVIASFEESEFDREVGIGVYDIHSPAIPTAQAMHEVLRRSVRAVPEKNIWVNPDCGLKTRNWKEVEPALRNMVEAAQKIRAEHQ